jgi:hypothetical protein
LRHEEKDARDAKGEGGDDRDAGRTVEDLDDIAPPAGEAAECVRRPRGDAAGSRL